MMVYFSVFIVIVAVPMVIMVMIYWSHFFHVCIQLISVEE